MTPSPNKTPPPTSRNQHSTPPPPPRKPRRSLRKRRRPPREARSPACIVCKRKRPLRLNGLCWSLECALQATPHHDNDTVTTELRDGGSDDKFTPPLLLCNNPPQQTVIHQTCTVSNPVLPNLSARLIEHPHIDETLASDPQLSVTTPKETLEHPRREIDQPSLDEEIRIQETHVQSVDPSERLHQIRYIANDNSDASHEDDENDEPEAT